MKIYKIKPYFSEKIWGTKNWSKFGFEKFNNKIGEAWLISAHENGQTLIENEEIYLKDFFEKNKKIFGDKYDRFPLLSKIINPSENLSVQVHPNDEYALANENDLGKPESWLILDCPENAEIIYGHNAKDEKEFIEMTKNSKWNTLLKKVKINKGDFIYVPPGKIHAITPDVVVFELQRSSDVTYRLYDFDRLQNGIKRELQITKSLANVNFPDIDDFIIRNANNNIFSSEFFSIYLLDSKKQKTFKKYESSNWMQLSVIEGEGQINGLSFKKGESAIMLEDFDEIKIQGDLKIIFYWIKN
ncbi:type I phosphomannose isomerase catalytic subunit [Mesoplasma florum]|uniref:type I phosphomannose isomerase catalytic subunit n=1 Tax=Mesoplasma florum TaxID=2151 RepID=UPI000D089D97|nr:type I phosphomannose isomerase catalytic subunit [Mesoplasma florum]AVN61307.1 mannose-6-phosphate isomerase [Mesoplasma florum]